LNQKFLIRGKSPKKINNKIQMYYFETSQKHYCLHNPSFAPLGQADPGAPVVVV